MWCDRCRQHVAAIVGDSGGGAVCANCGTEVDAFADLMGTSPLHAADLADRIPGTGLAQSTVETELSPLAYSRARLDHIGRRLDALAKLASATAVEKKPPAPGRRWSTAPIRTWIARVGLFSGLALLSCGIVLAGWSLLGGRASLWDFGLPIALAGQCLLLVALASQWNTRPRPAAEQMSDAVPSGPRRRESRVPS